jgi:hypothetical protein
MQGKRLFDQIAQFVQGQPNGQHGIELVNPTNSGSRGFQDRSQLQITVVTVLHAILIDSVDE